ncbi:MAG: PIN domain nuclease, partial [Caldilinea sp.]|nr:PIN domain nuclease [Caldilinea sp.]MDW8442467.1 PIN domain nuclease [Caldilineaceae bacterium]
MRFSPLLRIIGTALYGFIGWEIGLVLSRAPGLHFDSWQLVIPFTLLGAAFGFLLAPWLVRAPADAAQSALRRVPIIDLVAGLIGITFGLLIAALLSVPVSQLPAPFGNVVPLVLVFMCGYLGAAILVLRKHDFFSLLRGNAEQRASALRSEVALTPSNGPMLLLDTSVIIDGRIADVAKTGFLLGTLTVPRFVLNELQYIADSPDSLRRNRGRRGLEVLDRLQNTPEVAITFIDDDPADAQQVDDKLISLARQYNALIITNDYNLNRVARLQGVRILNINELANAVKSVYLPGEVIPLKIIQEGKEFGQGVGYLEDGTMVVVENGRRHLNSEVLVQVTKVLQTNAGRLIF